MGNRGVQALLVVLVVLIGSVSAVAVNSSRGKNRTASAGPTASASASASASPSPSPSASAEPSASPSPSASAEPSPTAAPTAAPTAPVAPPPGGGTPGGGTAASGCAATGSGGSGPAGYPAQIQAGRTYDYCGPRTLVSHATDSGESATGVCAGINESTQAFPSGYGGVFFVGVAFPDGQIVSAGYIRDASGRRAFGSIQNGNGSQKSGTVGADPGAGSHTYCVSRSGSGWVTTRDGNTIYTANESAGTLTGATLKFDADVQAIGSPGPQNFSFSVPGFHDILVGGAAPRQLRGAAYYS